VKNFEFLLEDQIKTNYSGYNQLCRFYHFCLGYSSNSNFHINFTEIEWFDGNLCALLWAMVYRLNKDFGHTFTTDSEVIKEHFDILYRNGFLKGEVSVFDVRKSTLPIQAFDCSNKEGFCDYVGNELLKHRGIPSSLTEELKEKITDDLLEVFCNTHYHANSKDPFFVGGQYYPKSGFLKFTMVDLGDGFLPRIKEATNGNINTSLEAILWALKGNSTKLVLEKCPGGLGIKSMYNYCQKSNGILQIISGNGFWSSDMEDTIFQGGRELPKPFMGTTINLIFKKD